MNYPYLDDKNFLKRLDIETRKVQYVRINILDFRTEAPIASIEGIATGGSVNANGTSNVRRTMSCSLLVVKNGIYLQGTTDTIDYSNITEVQNLVSMNKKVSAEIGFENTLSWDDACYPEYDKIWFPLGTFIIKTASVARNNSGINISLSLNDKTALLNGDVGGVIPAATVFSESELYNADATKRTVEQILIKDMIKYLVVDMGGEDPSNVIIEDIPYTIRKVVKWTGTTPLYWYGGEGKNFFSLESKIVINKGITIKPTAEYKYGQDCGFMVEQFHYPGTLECNAGETVAAMLDKIKNTLGNYEWFYDIWGRFHFQEKKNYINTSYATKIDELKESSYLPIMNLSKSVYTFDANNKKLVTSISKAPQYQNIKNDFVVWGSTKTASGATKPIRYHLVFDTKPEPGQQRLCIVYTDYRGLQQVIVLNEKNYRIGTHHEYPDGDKTFYYLIRVQQSNYLVEYWDEETQTFRIFDEWEVCHLRTSDWRTELYFRGLENTNKAFAKNYYSAELNAEWPKIYDVRAESTSNGAFGKIYTGAYRDIDPSQYEYFLDFIEGRSGGNVNLSQFNVNNIGRRTKIGKDNSANCVFAAEIPNIMITKTGVGTDIITGNDYSGYVITQVDEEIFNKMVIGGNNTSAYDKVKELLIQHTHYNEAITLTVLPIYYLEPNSRIHIEDTELGINGDYMINTISLPLTIGTSNLSCSKCIENTI